MAGERLHRQPFYPGSHIKSQGSYRATQIDHEFYPWKNPGEDNARDKVAALLHIPDRQWVVGVSTYFDELIDTEKYRTSILEMFKSNENAYNNYKELKLLDLEGNHLVRSPGNGCQRKGKKLVQRRIGKIKTKKARINCTAVPSSTARNSTNQALHLSHVVRNPDTDEPIAMVVADGNIDLIQNLIANTAGLGSTGESYLVGRDYIMRTNSPRSSEPTVLKQKVETGGVKDVFAKGKKESANASQEWIYKNYLGRPVLGCKPLHRRIGCCP